MPADAVAILIKAVDPDTVRAQVRAREVQPPEEA